MATLHSDLSDGAAGGVGKVIVGEEPEPDDREPVKMRAAIFFDGTQNNRTNIETRLANAEATVVTIDGRQVEMTGSFMSSYSNVAILEYMNKIEDETVELSVYVEGIGTVDNDKDDDDGLIWGSGPTGVPAKVTNGIAKLALRIEKILQDTDKRLGELTVDAFGFSRGAAAARHFVSRRTAEHFGQLTDLSTSVSVPAEAIIINFVGVFDTVSSYAGESTRSFAMRAAGNILFDTFGDDVDELKLALHGVPKRIVQLGAADEYRKVFSRTTITTSRLENVGFECILPGVHSDVGGGYVAEEWESRVVDTYERQRFIDEGWYQPDQLPPPSGIWVRLGTSTRSTGRRLVRNNYQFIPLSLMMQLAGRFGVTFKPLSDPEFAAYRVPDRLRPLSTRMHRDVLHHHDTALGEEFTFELTPNYYWVRNEYLHRSNIKGMFDKQAIAMAGREKDGMPDREIIYDDGIRR